MAVIWIPKRLVEISLINAASKDAKAFVDHCEIEYEYRVAAAAAEIVKGGYKIIMLTGPSSSGKTTTAHKLANAICAMNHTSRVISLDDFYLDLDKYPRLPDGSKDYENVTALDLDEIHRCLQEIVEKGETDLPQFDFVNECRKAERKHIDLKGGVAVVEGIHALNPLLTETLPQNSVYKIYAGMREEYALMGQRVLPTRDIRLMRRIIRDSKFRGHSPEKTAAMWPAVCEGEDKYIKVFKRNADLLLDTSFSSEVCLFSGYVKEMTEKFPKDSPYTEKLLKIAEYYNMFNEIDQSYLPKGSMLREFIG